MIQDFITAGGDGKRKQEKLVCMPTDSYFCSMLSFPFSREQIEEAFTRDDCPLRVLIDSMPDFFFIKDKDLRFLGMNRAMATFFGLSDASEARGRTEADFFSRDDAESMAADDARLLASGEPACDQERRVTTRHGDLVWLLEHRIPVRDSSGQVISILGMLRNITRIKSMEQELRNTNMKLSDALVALKQTQQRVIQNERLNALGEMASGIAHDFNNALMPILGYSDVMIARPELLDDKEESLRLLKDIRTAAMDASNAVRRLREFYRTADDEEQTKGDLNKQVNTAIVLTRPKWESEMGAHGIMIRVDTHLGEIPLVNARESQLREVLINLILNAIDAMPSGGVITIRTVREGRRVLLEVKDGGVGMTEEVKQRCFEPFFTTKGDGGTGLGLSLTYGFVQRHKGTIEIESAPGCGTLLRLWLPCDGDGLHHEETMPKSIAMIRPLRVLVMDDEQTSRRLFERYLKVDGHSVDTVADGHSGLEKHGAGGYDMIITDRAMADMSGDQVAREVRKTDMRIPIIMVTGFGDIMQDENEKPSGVDIVLSKPVTHNVLREAIARMASGRPG